MKEIILNNIELSSQIIVFDRQTQLGQLSITNKHDKLGVIFKIKTTKLNVIDVKPAKGFIKPLNKVTITFKINQNTSPQQIQVLQRSDKFLLQFLNITNQQVSRQEIQDIWKAFKNGTANLQHGYGCYKVSMNLTGKRMNYSNTKNSANNMKISQQRNRPILTSIIKKQQQLKQSVHSSSSNFDNQSTQNQELAKKFKQYKDKQKQLEIKRQNLFLSKSSSLSSSSSKGTSKSLIILIVLFIIAFLSGNYLRSSMVKVKPVQKKQKSFFSSLFNKN